jgi:hypothetical protein
MNFQIDKYNGCSNAVEQEVSIEGKRFRPRRRPGKRQESLLACNGV